VRTFWITLLAVVTFAVIVLARLPASWVVPTPPAAVSCAAVDGTIWNGVCTGLTVDGKPTGDVVWELHASGLLRGKIDAHVVLTKAAGTASPGALSPANLTSLTAAPAITVRADVEAGLDKNITARNVVADLPLDPSIVPNIPPTLRGSVHADLASVRVEKGIVTQLQGKVEAHDLEDRSGNVTRLGSYSLTFPPSSGAEPTGQLHDLGDGPLVVEGTLRLTREPGFDLEGLVKPRPTAPAELQQNIQYLGSPDAQGRRPFSLAGTF
jgi:general secretion pathway protein N